MATFDGLTALVTGIGLAAARLLATQGAAVGVLDRGEQGPADFAYARGDVSEDASVRAGVQQLVDVLGGLDILVNNAGIGAQGGIEDNDDNEWHRVFDVNVLGLVRVTRAALPALRASQHGAIVNTCSIAATAGLPQRALYSASKGAVLSLTSSAARSAAESGAESSSRPRRASRTAGWSPRECRRCRGLTAFTRMPSAGGRRREVGGSTTGTALEIDGGMAGLRLRPRFGQS